MVNPNYIKNIEGYFDKLADYSILAYSILYYSAPYTYLRILVRKQ